MSGRHSTAAAARLAGATVRQADWWARNGVITPSVESSGSGHPRRWSDADVAVLTVLAQVATALDLGRNPRVVAERVAAAAVDHAAYDDVWVDLGHGVSLVVERRSAEAAA